MKTICPRFGNGVNYRSRGETNLRAKIRLLQFEFLYGINRRRVERIHDGRVLLHTHGAHAINQDVGLRIAATIRDKVVGHCVGTERVARGLGNSRCPERQIEYRPADQGKIVDELWIKSLSGNRIFGSHYRGLPHDLNGLAGFSYLQRNIYSQVLVNNECDPALLARAKTSSFHVYAVCPW